MEIRQLHEPAALPNVGGHLMALDLEMANSFRRGPGVICMIGLERYQPEKQAFSGAIATITAREEEEALVRWLLESLGHFQAEQPQASLLTFAGRENDLPWLRERIRRYGIAEADAAPLNLPHVDLKEEFHKSTYHDEISLKRLEALFQLQRVEEMTSRKVSFLLTDVLSGGRGKKHIPEAVMRYLHQDVRNLLQLRSRWSPAVLERVRLSEAACFNQFCSFTRLLRKVRLARRAGLDEAQQEQLLRLEGELETTLEQVLRDGGFEHLALPDLFEVPNGRYDWERVCKRYRQLQKLTSGNGRPYPLRKQFHKPKGALAVVRQGARILMIKRSQNVRAPGLWGLPGGELEDGETPAQAAVRELEEEVGLQGRAHHLLGVTKSHSGHFVLLWVEVEVKEGAGSAFRLNPYEVAEARWVSPEELLSLHPLIGGTLEGFQQVLGSPWSHPPARRRGPRP